VPITPPTPDQHDWWRDARFYLLLATQCAAFAINLALDSAVFFMFLSIPVVVAASIAGPRATVGLGITGLSLAVISVAAVDDQFFTEPEAALRLAVFMAVIGAAVWLAYVQARSESRRSAAEAELDRRARFDDLTGLPNRAEALGLVTASLRQTRRHGDRLDVLFVDVDGFKDINDRHGHLCGDAVLVSVAERLRTCLRVGDFAARIGGDEFLVGLHGALSTAVAVAAADRIREAVVQPLDVQGVRVQPAVSIGVTRATAEDDVDSVLARADAAMYEAKRRGRNQVAVA
jgi:diguanylate cyclase (GGDEF)-like protein